MTTIETTTAPVKLLLGPADAAAAMSISRSRLYELIASGELRAIKSGRSRLIPVAEIERWIRRQLEDAA